MNVVARFLGVFAIVLAGLIGNPGTAAAANPLLCFDGHSEGTIYGGHCTLFSDGSGATLDNQEGDPDGNYSGVYYATTSVSGKPLSAVTDLSFTYSGTPTAGSPRISLPIDADNDGDRDFYAFIGAFYCNDGLGHVDAVHDSTCQIFWTYGTTSGSDANWAAFVAAHPTWSVSHQSSTDVPFVVADDPGIWTVRDVHFEATTSGGGGGKPPSDKDKCKKGGWMELTRADGSSFKNQGDCIQYANTGK